MEGVAGVAGVNTQISATAVQNVHVADDAGKFRVRERCDVQSHMSTIYLDEYQFYTVVDKIEHCASNACIVSLTGGGQTS